MKYLEKVDSSMNEVLAKAEEAKSEPETAPNDPVTILTRADGVTITLQGAWEISKGD